MEQKQKRPTAYSYVRMSSQQQIKGDSLRRQLDLSRKYAAENNLILDETLSDIGVSAWTGANVKEGALGRFLQLIQTGKIARGSYLLVESLDRLSRQQVRNAVGPFIEIINAGIVIVTLADKQIYSEATVDENWTQLMLSLAIMSRAHEESETKSRRLKEVHAAKKAKAAQGIGRFTPNMPGWIDQIEVAKDKFEYRLNAHAKTVRRIFEMADAGLGQLVITRRLNDDNIPTFRGKAAWHQPSVGRVLRNPAVIGTYQPTVAENRKTVPLGQPIANYLPAAIPEELYWRVQRGKKSKLSSGRKGQTLSNLFTSLCVCEHCNGPIRLRATVVVNDEQIRYLHCDNKYREGGCPGKGGGFRYDYVENAILDHIKEFDLDVGTGRHGSDIESLNQSLAETEDDIAEKTKRRNKLMAAIEFADDPETIRDMVDKVTKRGLEISNLNSLRSELKEKIAQAQNEKSQIASAPERIYLERLKWTTAPVEEVYESRSTVSRMIRAYTESISFNFNRKVFTVSIAKGLFTYRFNSKGEFIEKLDNLDQLRTTASEVWDYDENGNQIPGSSRIELNTPLTLGPKYADIRRLQKAGLPVPEYDPKVQVARDLRDRLVKERFPTVENPRINDPEVQALKALRQAAAREYEEKKSKK